MPLGQLWDLLVDGVCRPPRDDQYDVEDLIGGSGAIFQIADTVGVRQDITLLNKLGQKLACSHYKPYTAKEGEWKLPCVVYAHCNSGSRRDGEEAVFLLIPLGISVFTVDFAGSGVSEGNWVTLGASESEDLQSVLSYLRASGTTSTIGLWGRSMGAVTAMMAAQNDQDVDAMVLDSPFCRLTDLIMEVAQQLKLPIPKYFLKRLVGAMRRSVQKRAGFDIKDVAPLDRVNNCKMPALFGHGTEDSHIDISHSRKLHDAYGGDRNILFFRGNHLTIRPTFFYITVAVFFYRHLRVKELLPDGPTLDLPALEALARLVTGTLAKRLSKGAKQQQDPETPPSQPIDPKTGSPGTATRSPGRSQDPMQAYISKDGSPNIEAWQNSFIEAAHNGSPLSLRTDPITPSTPRGNPLMTGSSQGHSQTPSALHSNYSSASRDSPRVAGAHLGLSTPRAGTASPAPPSARGAIPPRPVRWSSLHSLPMPAEIQNPRASQPSLGSSAYGTGLTPSSPHPNGAPAASPRVSPQASHRKSEPSKLAGFQPEADDNTWRLHHHSTNEKGVVLCEYQGEAPNRKYRWRIIPHPDGHRPDTDPSTLSSDTRSSCTEFKEPFLPIPPSSSDPRAPPPTPADLASASKQSKDKEPGNWKIHSRVRGAEGTVVCEYTGKPPHRRYRLRVLPPGEGVDDNPNVPNLLQRVTQKLQRTAARSRSPKKDSKKGKDRAKEKEKERDMRRVSRDSRRMSRDSSRLSRESTREERRFSREGLGDSRRTSMDSSTNGRRSSFTADAQEDNSMEWKLQNKVLTADGVLICEYRGGPIHREYRWRIEASTPEAPSIESTDPTLLLSTLRRSADLRRSLDFRRSLNLDAARRSSEYARSDLLDQTSRRKSMGSHLNNPDFSSHPHASYSDSYNIQKRLGSQSHRSAGGRHIHDLSPTGLAPSPSRGSFEMRTPYSSHRSPSPAPSASTMDTTRTPRGYRARSTEPHRPDSSLSQSSNIVNGKQAARGQAGAVNPRRISLEYAKMLDTQGQPDQSQQAGSPDRWRSNPLQTGHSVDVDSYWDDDMDDMPLPDATEEWVLLQSALDVCGIENNEEGVSEEALKLYRSLDPGAIMSLVELHNHVKEGGDLTEASVLKLPTIRESKESRMEAARSQEAQRLDEERAQSAASQAATLEHLHRYISTMPSPEDTQAEAQAQAPPSVNGVPRSLSRSSAATDSTHSSCLSSFCNGSTAGLMHHKTPRQPEAHWPHTQQGGCFGCFFQGGARKQSSRGFMTPR